MITTIFVDMDGVLTDFERAYKEKFGSTAREVRANRQNKEYTRNWEQFVKDREFETLPWFPGGKELLQFLKSIPIEKKILSSTGGERFHSFVAEQKTAWLNNNSILWDRELVAGRSKKKLFARSDTILIDDTLDVIDAFSNAGGYGILHTNVEKTINLINVYTRIMV